MPIPAGKAKDMEKEIPNVLAEFCHEGNPTINFPRQDLPTFYTASLASALFTVKGLEDAAEAVHEYGLLTCQNQDPDLPKLVNALIRDSFGKRLHPKKWANFDPFTDSKEKPVACVLLGSNGGTYHAVMFSMARFLKQIFCMRWIYVTKLLIGVSHQKKVRWYMTSVSNVIVGSSTKKRSSAWERKE